MLSSVISESQSAFIKGRLISDNILVATEIVHWLKRKTQGKVGFTALKVDMSKAFDKIEWNFLRDMLVKLGFCQRFVNLLGIMFLVMV